MPSCVAYNCMSRSSTYLKSLKIEDDENQHQNHPIINHGSNKRTKKICFFAFPNNPELRKRWVSNCRRKNWKPSKWSKLCSKHFMESEIIKHNIRYSLVDGAIPTIFDFPEHLMRVESNRRVLKRSAPKENNEEIKKDKNVDDIDPPSNIFLEHSYSLPHTLELLGEVNKRTRLHIMTLEEENEKLLANLKVLKNEKKALYQKNRRLHRRITRVKDLCSHLK